MQVYNSVTCNTLCHYNTSVLPVVHVVGHVLDDVVVQMVRAEAVGEGGRVHGLVVAVCDPGVLHHIGKTDPLLWICCQELLQQVHTFWIDAEG